MQADANHGLSQERDVPLASENNETERDDPEMEQLVRLAMTGSKQALADLCRKMARPLLLKVKMLLPNHHDAEDVTQEVLIQMCQKLHTLKDPKAFRGWVGTIALNMARSYRRRDARQGKVIYLDSADEQKTEIDKAPLPEEKVLSDEEYEEVMKMVNTLPSRQREAVVLRYYDELSEAEIAAAMRVTQPAVSLYLKLARERLKKKLSRLTGEGERAGRYAVLSAMPMGLLLSKTLHSSARMLLAPKGAGLFGAKDAVKEALNKILKGILPVAASALILFFAITAASGLAKSAPAADAQVIFTGGDARYGHLNPQSAEARFETAVSDVSWQITPYAGGEVLLSGEGAFVSEPFSVLPQGVYRITFFMIGTRGEGGSVFAAFQIRGA